VTQDAAIDEGEICTTARSAAGMTAKVVKGSIWTLAGQMLPMAVGLFTMPFVIRFLGSEQYGVLILVNLIPAYFSFADLGMNVASTKFASEAYAEGNDTREAETVWTAGLIAFISSAVVAIPMLLFADWIVSVLNVPENLHRLATIALRIASVSFVLGVLSSILNTPQLSRLRMDLNTAVNMIPRVLYTLAVPLILYLGFGIVGAVTGLLIAGIVTVLAHLFVSAHLQPKLLHVRWNFALTRPLLKFAFGWVFLSVAAMVLVNSEKLVLTRMVSVQSLAHYSVAFMFANLATTFSGAMLQSLLPAFSQLQGDRKRKELEMLFTRSMRFNMAWLPPILMIMLVGARLFLTLWAGEEFGRESTFPFYILIAGLFFNILAYIPQTTILAAGETAKLAKIYWIELTIYLPTVLLMVYYLGILGAAAAWSLRVTLDFVLIIRLARQNEGVNLRFLTGIFVWLAAASLFAIPIAFALLYDNFSLYLVPMVLVSLAIYATIIWGKFLETGERERIRGILRTLRYKFAF
jgi:O-antigen/teichoic acid export membrane protein